MLLALGAVPFLAERIGPPRAATLAVGLKGGMLILQPGFGETGLAMIAVEVVSALWADMGLCAKELTQTDNSEQIVALNRDMAARCWPRRFRGRRPPVSDSSVPPC